MPDYGHPLRFGSFITPVNSPAAQPVRLAVLSEATAYGWREANFSVAAFGTRSSGLDRWWERLIPHLEGMYLSFETATGPEVLARAFPPGHLTRLRALKQRYDPTGLFRDNFFIDPRAVDDAAA